jgi:integrase
MATIRKLKTKAGTTIYQARWSVPGPAGKRQQRTKNFGNAKDAKAFAARQTTEVERKGVGDPHKRSFGAYLRSWLATLRDRAELSPVTIAGYERHAAMLIRELGAIPLEKLTAGEIEAGLGRLRQSGGKVQKRLKKGAVADSRQLAPRTVHHVFSVCHNALEQARRWRLVGENVARDVKPPVVGKSQATAYAVADIDKLYDAARSPEMVLAIALLATTGTRRSELLGLAFDAIDMANATITIKRTVIEARVDGVRVRIVRPIAKTKASLRTFSIARELVDMLIEHRKRLLETALALGPTFAREPLYLFPGSDGLPIMPYLMTQRLDAVRKRAGVKGVDPVHGFRHAHATILLASGTNPVVVSKRLGHSSPAVALSVYAHALPQSDKEAAESVAHLIRKSGPNEA